MIANNSFSQTVDLLHRSMSATTLRQAVYANNMANVNTPNFKRTEVTFESQLGRALDSRQNRPALLLQRLTRITSPTGSPWITRTCGPGGRWIS